MEGKNRRVGLGMNRGLAGDGDRVVPLSGVGERPSRIALLPSDVCFLRSENKNGQSVAYWH